MQLQLSHGRFIYTLGFGHLGFELFHLVPRLVQHLHYLGLMSPSPHDPSLLGGCELSAQLSKLDTVSQLQLLHRGIGAALLQDGGRLGAVQLEVVVVGTELLIAQLQ